MRIKNPNINWDTASFSYGDLNVGSSATETFTLENTGDADVEGCSAVILSDPVNFSIASSTCIGGRMNSGQSCLVEVASHPNSSGLKTLSIKRVCAENVIFQSAEMDISANGVEPILSFSPLMYDFGSIMIGQTTSPEAFTLSNTGTADSSGCGPAFISDAVNFSISADTCGSAPLSIASSCLVSIEAHPVSLGLKSATLVRACSFGGLIATTVNQIRVTGTGTPILAWSPLTHSFGNINSGSNSSSQIFTLSNSGNLPATGCLAPTISDTTHFSILSSTCSASSLSVGGTCDITVQAHPTSIGLKSATVSRSCTVGGVVATTANQITVTGTAPILAWSPLTNSFGNVNAGSNSAEQTFVLTNSGDGSATTCSVPVISDTVNFTILTDTCNASNLSASGTCEISVQANPTSIGLKTATISRSCAVGGVVTTTANQITVTGVSPALAWSPLTHSFGSVNSGSNSAAQTFTLTNSGTGSATTCSVPVISDVINFAIVTDNCSTFDLNASGTCEITVQANPVTTGLKIATVSRSCAVGGTVTTTVNQITATGTAPNLAWSPLTHSFGNINAGSNSSSQIFTLTNSGNGSATTCSIPTISDTTNFTILTDTCSTSNLSASGTCNITVRANPASVGLKDATVSRNCSIGGTITTTANQITVTGTSPSLAWSPLTHSFGNVSLGSSSSAQTFTLTNSGAGSATTCSAPTITDTTNFTILTDTCSTSNLSASGTCEITVQANPATTGLKDATVSRSCTDGGVVTTTANQITVTGTGTLNLAWSPLTHGFGNLNVGSSSSAQTFTLTNSGNGSATTCSAPTITDTTNFTILTDTCNTTNLVASGTCEITVRANPASVGLKSATVSRSCSLDAVVTSTDAQLTVTGTSPSLAWSPLTHSFGSLNVGLSSAAQTFTLTNSGNGDATSCSTPTITDTTNFTILTDTCTTSDLSVSGACEITVQANPTTTGLKSATVSRSCSVGGTVTTTANQITTTGTAPNLAWSPLTHSFGSLNVGSSSAAQTFTLTNSGTGSATTCSAPTISNTTNFTILTDTCSTSNLSASGTCSISVQANPASIGLKTATVSRSCADGGVVTTTANQITATGTAPNLAWSPLTYNFGNLNLGSTSAAQTFTLTNSGTGSATSCSAPTISNTTDFTILTDTCTTSNLSVSATCGITVQADPQSLGLKTATVSRNCSIGGVVTTTANQITVTGVFPTLTWSPLTHNFGNAHVGSNSADRTFTLTNSGNGGATSCYPVGITNTTDFTIITDGCDFSDLNPGDSCDVVVQANPQSTGLKTATIARTCDYGGSVSTTLDQITVTGTAPNLTWSPLTHSFGNINAGATSTAQTFTLTNSGDGSALLCSAPTISNTTDFTILTDTCLTSDLAASGTCNISVRANPTTLGAKTATVSRICFVGGEATTTANQITVTGAAPNLAWSPLTHGFGNINVGSNSTAQTFTLTNSGAGSATTCSAPTISNTTDFTILTDTCTTSNLSASGTCNISVRANPASIGLKTATVSRTCSVGGTVTTTANQITVTGPLPNLAWSPLTHGFGNINVGANSTAQTFTLTNSGAGSATTCSAPTISNTTDFTILTDTCTTSNLSASGTCNISVRANPTTVGLKTATVSRTCSVGGTVTTTANQITVTGLGAILAWSPLAWGYGSFSVGSNGLEKIFTLTNSGTGSATSCSSPTISDTVNFVITSNTCSTSDLSASSTCTIGLSMNPQSVGSKTATLSRTCTNGGTATTTANQITLTATPWLGITDWLKDDELTTFGFVPSGGVVSSATTRYYYRNFAGPTLLNCTDPVLSNTTDFNIVSENCTSTQSAGTACIVDVKANPVTVGLKSGNLSRTCDQTGTVTVALMNVTGGTSNTTTLQVDVGDNHSCALISDGTIKCWGDNAYGQLGNGSTTDSAVPVLVSGISTATKVSAGVGRTCALLSGGSVQCWGRNNTQQLGDGTTTQRTSPVNVTHLPAGVIDISVGDEYSAAVMSDNTIRWWGVGSANYNPFPSITTATQSAAGDQTKLCTRLSSGSVNCNGAVISNILNAAASTGPTDSKIASGLTHSCAVTTAGAVMCWGTNTAGQLGNNSTTTSAAAVFSTGITTAEQVAVSDRSSCALLSNDTVTCWGNLQGTGSTTTGSVAGTLTPVVISGISGVKQIDGGGDHFCAVLNDESIKCWGDNTQGQLGEDIKPGRVAFERLVPGITTATQVATGASHNCVLLSTGPGNGTIKCWGYNEAGQLGDGSRLSKYSPVLVPGITTAIDVRASSEHTCALLSTGPGNGDVKCWGRNTYGRIGDGTTAIKINPTDVLNVTGATQIAVGTHHSCALISGGSVKCWGRNTYGQIGDGTTTDRPTPVAVPGITTATQIALGGYFTCALLGDQTVKCWGLNSSGELGDTTLVNKTSPVTVSGLNTVSYIATGGETAGHACAIRLGFVKCWGLGMYGRLGDGTSADRSSPVDTGVSPAVKLSLGQNTSCALLTSGQIQCWGYNVAGAIGDGTFTASNVAVYRYTEGSILNIGYGGGTSQHMCNVTTLGTVYCSGDYEYNSAGMNELVFKTVSGF